MDSTLISLIPGGGIVSVLALVIIYLMRQNHADRVQYRNDVARIEARSVQDIKDLHAQHKTEMAEVKDELVALRESNEKVIDELEKERRLRWAAEDAAAGFRRELQEIRGKK